MSLEITKNVAYLIIALVAAALLITTFVFKMLFNLFIGRSFCIFLGEFFLKLLLGDSIFLGISVGGVSAACSVISF